MFGLGTGELVLILAVVILVFGASKLPQLGDGLGKAIKNFKRGFSNAEEIEPPSASTGTPPSTK